MMATQVIQFISEWLDTQEVRQIDFFEVGSANECFKWSVNWGDLKNTIAALLDTKTVDFLAIVSFCFIDECVEPIVHILIRDGSRLCKCHTWWLNMNVVYKVLSQYDTKIYVLKGVMINENERRMY